MAKRKVAREWAPLSVARKIVRSRLKRRVPPARTIRYWIKKGLVKTMNGGGGSWHVVQISSLMERVRVLER